MMGDQRPNIERLLSRLGTGKWQLLHFITTGCTSLVLAPHVLGGAFLTPKLEFQCRPPLDTQDAHFFLNDSDTESCNYFAQSRDGSLREESCTEWEFDNSTFTNTVTSEFGLVCQLDYLRASYTSLYMIGVLIGSPISGILADKYGRKTVFGTSTLFYAIIGNVSCWLPNLPSIMAARLILGTLHTPALKTGFILAMEIANPEVRSFVGIMLYLPWALATIAWGGLAYLLRSWRYLLMSGSLPSLVLLPAIWYMDESPRWLVLKGKQDRAVKVLKKAARWNKLDPISDDEILMLQQENLTQDIELSKTKPVTRNSSWMSMIKEYLIGLLILFRTPRLRLASIVMHLDFLVLGLVYFGLTLNGGNFRFDRFFYMVLMGIVELPAYTIMAPVVSRFGRRVPIAFFYVFSGVVLLVQPFLPSDPLWLTILLVLLGKMAISISFQGNNFYATELFPTEVRTRGVTSAFMLSRVGSAVAPFINDYLGQAYAWAPSVLFGGASAIAGIATYMLWETKGLALPETIAQLEGKNFKPSKKKNKDYVESHQVS